MIRAYADDALVYSPAAPSDFALLGLTATTSAERAGTAEIVMPPRHPAYDAFTSYRTIVTIYRMGELLFRGRALYSTDDMRGRRTIICEGERCFLRDVTMRPFAYNDTPANIFRAIMAQYNARAEAFKRFKVGEVTVTADAPVEIDSEECKLVSEVVDQLAQDCGGFIVFTTAEDGSRVINWLAELSRTSGQAIEFGENLLDYSSTGANTALATVIVPYGAKDDATGQRITIKSVNGGLDYIQDDAAVALRGTVEQAVYWDDITDPAALLAKARQHLETSKLIVTSLELTAVDLSALDRSIDTFRAGEWVRVRSIPHNMDTEFLLRTRTYDLLDPARDTVVLGKDRLTLTGSDVSNAKNNLSRLQRTAANIKTDYTKAIANAELTVNETMAENLRQEMAGTYAPKVNTVDASVGQYMTGDGFLTQWGAVTITPTASGTPTSVAVAYAYPYAVAPAVLPSMAAPDPASTTLSLDKTDPTVLVITVTSSSTSPVKVEWLAIGVSA